MSQQAWANIAVGEEAAIYAYGVLSAKLSGAKKKAGISAIDAHRNARDVARRQLAKDDLSPSAPVAYDLPFDVTNAKTASLLAATVELRLTDLYLALVAGTVGKQRQQASESAQASTASATSWGWTPTAFPSASNTGPAPSSTQPGSSESADQPAPASTVSADDGATLQ